MRIERSAFDSIVDGSATIEDVATSGRLAVEGDAVKLGELLGLLEEPSPAFPIVTPWLRPFDAGQPRARAARTAASSTIPHWRRSE